MEGSQWSGGSLPVSLGDLLVADASPDMVVGCDEAGRIVYVNPAVERCLGWGPDELLGHVVERLVPDAFAASHAEYRVRYGAAPTSRPMGLGRDFVARRRDGGEVPVEISLAPVSAPSGEQLVFATIIDTTKRKGLETQLLEARKMESLGRLAGGVAHDFNNILFVIRGTADLALSELARDPQLADDWLGLRADLEQIAFAADRAAEITRQLLAFGRGREVRVERVDVAEVAGRLEPLLRTLVGDRVRLDLRLDPSAGTVAIGPGQFDQILVNLVVNARDALPRGGSIRIEARGVEFDSAYADAHLQVDPGSYAMLSVSDDGEGMDQETRLHVFEPFFTTKEPGRGTGLGLSTIYGVVRSAGGHVWLYTELGQGTTFKVYLPRLPGEDAKTPAVSPEASRLGSPDRVVMVAEDDTVVRLLTVRILERAGYTVVATIDAEHALAALTDPAQRIDALVSDVSMPGVTGPELARAARQARPGIGILLVSGFLPESEPIDDLLASGAMFVSKPVSAAELLDLLHEVLGG